MVTKHNLLMHRKIRFL